jgi:hypothetical protein
MLVVRGAWCVVLGAWCCAWCLVLVARCRPLTASAARPLTPCILPYPSGTPRHARLTQHISAHLITLHPLTHTQHSPMSIPSHMHPSTSPTNPLVRHRLALRRTQFHRRLPSSVVTRPCYREPPNSIINYPTPASIILSATIKLYRRLPYRLPYP